jgi:hypothetical protein
VQDCSGIRVRAEQARRALITPVRAQRGGSEEGLRFVPLDRRRNGAFSSPVRSVATRPVSETESKPALQQSIGSTECLLRYGTLNLLLASPRRRRLSGSVVVGGVLRHVFSPRLPRHPSAGAIIAPCPSLRCWAIDITAAPRQSRWGRGLFSCEGATGWRPPALLGGRIVVALALLPRRTGLPRSNDQQECLETGGPVCAFRTVRYVQRDLWHDVCSPAARSGRRYSRWQGGTSGTSIRPTWTRC